MAPTPEWRYIERVNGRTGQEVAEDKLAAIRETFKDVLDHIENSRVAAERSSTLIKKSRELIRRSNDIVDRRGMSELYRL